MPQYQKSEPVLPLWGTGPYFLAVWKAWCPTCPVTVNQHDVEALLDSGSARTLVRESVLEAASLAQGVQTPPSLWWLAVAAQSTKKWRITALNLVSVNYATRYPEATRFRKPNAKQIAKELFIFSTQVGIPKKILTDQGTPFISRVTREICDLLQVT